MLGCDLEPVFAILLGDGDVMASQRDVTHRILLQTLEGHVEAVGLGLSVVSFTFFATFHLGQEKACSLEPDTTSI